MTKFKNRLPVSVAIAVGIHVVAALFLVVSFQTKRDRPIVAPAVDTVMAKVIDAEKLAEEKKRREEEIKRKQRERKEKLAEQERLKKEKRDKELAAKRAAEKKKAEKKREERERKKIAEAKRLAQEKREKEQERKRQAAEREAEKRRLSENFAREEAALKAEEELEAQRIAKKREMDRLAQQYLNSIRSRVQSRWRKPPGAKPDEWCEVHVQQTPSGVVKKIAVKKCTGDTAFRHSVEEAVRRSDPLPKPPSPELFDRELRFTFAPEEM